MTMPKFKIKKRKSLYSSHLVWTIYLDSDRITSYTTWEKAFEHVQKVQLKWPESFCTSIYPQDHN